MHGLNCTCKQVEISEILHKNNIDLDLPAVQESWEVTGNSKFSVPGYTWFGKPRSKELCKNLKRGDGGVGFFVREGLKEIIIIINDIEYDESMIESSVLMKLLIYIAITSFWSFVCC